MRYLLAIFLAVCWAVPDRASAQPAAPSSPRGNLQHVVGGGPVTLFRSADSSQAYVELSFQEPVRVKGDSEEGWAEVVTRDGAHGFVRARSLSNVWIRVNKREQAVYVYRGTRLQRTFRADFGPNAFADKEQRGGYTAPDHWRTPEGRFFVVDKNSHSQFHRALVLNYPTAEDAYRGLRAGLITEPQFKAIKKADEQNARPPMDTPLGGFIEIHGDGTGGGTNWTHGCVALRNDALDWLWLRARIGTPIVIE